MESIKQVIKYIKQLSFIEFQKYLDNNFENLHIDFYRDLWSQIKVKLKENHDGYNKMNLF